MEQKLQLDQIESVYIEKSRRVHELRQAQATGEGASSMLKMLRVETQRNRDSEQRLLREKEEKLKKLQQVEVSLAEPSASQSTVAELLGECSHMESSCEALEVQIDGQSGNDSKLTVYRQQASLVSKKRELAQQDLKSLIDERDLLSKQLLERESAFEARSGHKYMKKDDFKVRDRRREFKFNVVIRTD